MELHIDSDITAHIDKGICGINETYSPALRMLEKVPATELS